ncbi:SDR family NAD(P)-dependent oxidoreductase [Alteromonas sp. McT4-15]|uniref:SDR family NAD(P)-dependent oxidoreductase n=1 Tax=Alteromonas sp. McT4-15 TaxID=2881256 RepID=UPI001CF7EE9F|nr:SDR family NAD(P)-dependent oxidoreductase [Alteromonas sp. McT4-15]MCB4435713.1 SDR family NAD(P)-dependent oxidoreductase [Alteromonas sp. McT4-15]
MKKTVLITGATSGIGQQLAIEMGKLGHDLILLYRDADKLESTLSQLSSVADNVSVHAYLADLADIDSVKRAARAIGKKHDQIDVLVNNAGAFHMTKEMTPSGHEKTMMVNYFSHFVLTMMLLDNLRASKQGRVINVSSECYKMRAYSMDDFEMVPKYHWGLAYNRSKLAQVQLTKMLKEKLKDDNVTVTSVNPGAIDTNIYEPISGFMRFMLKFSLKPVEKGVTDIIDIALRDDSSDVNGEFISKSKKVAIDKRFLDPQQMQVLWQQSEDLLHTN